MRIIIATILRSWNIIISFPIKLLLLRYIVLYKGILINHIAWKVPRLPRITLHYHYYYYYCYKVEIDLKDAESGICCCCCFRSTCNDLNTCKRRNTRNIQPVFIEGVLIFFSILFYSSIFRVIKRTKEDSISKLAIIRKIYSKNLMPSSW